MRVATGLLKVLVPVAVLGVVLVRFGTDPFLDGVRTAALSSAALAAAAAALLLTALSTLCAAWRWQVVSRELGASIRLRDAVAAYYRSQLLNATLPFGIAGDVHRGVVHGRETDDTVRGLRTVAWERLAGQAVCAVVAAAVLVAAPSPLREAAGSALGVTAVVLGVVLVAALAVVALLPGHWRTILATDVRDVVRRPSRTVQVVVASVLAFCGHVAVLLVAVRLAAPEVSVTTVLPAALFVLLAASVPTSLAGWGPREGAAAWAFGAGGLSASQGVEISVVYGLLALLATAPGVVVLLLDARGRIRASTPQLTGAADA
ncbi:lysylphosphatidylglycerol synthase transmembrane domain-containing protein [Mumia sp. DW29H23]|uniref:lysylphosphatidylglycerol synthase transmembrane domain-containing protein n=1 Tax=Mumia sp. DW29H23 TaxID=3421241 RepID=UPI003D696FB5